MFFITHSLSLHQQLKLTVHATAKKAILTDIWDQTFKVNHRPPFFKFPLVNVGSVELIN